MSNDQYSLPVPMTTGTIEARFGNATNTRGQTHMPSLTDFRDAADRIVISDDLVHYIYNGAYVTVFATAPVQGGWYVTKYNPDITWLNEIGGALRATVDEFYRQYQEA